MSSHIQVSKWSNPDYQVSQAEIQAYLDDYKKALTTTLAELMTWYLQDDEQIKNSDKEYANCIRAILTDAGISFVTGPETFETPLTSGNQEENADHFASINEAPKSPKFNALGFIRKPYLEILIEDFDNYIEERCQCAPLSTVELEFQIFSAVCTFGTKKRWCGYGFHNPMKGACPPKRFIKRNRRLSAPEEELLLEAARNEDDKYFITNLVVENKEIYEELEKGTKFFETKIQQLTDSYGPARHARQFEAFVLFMLLTGARWTEVLSLEWSDIDLNSQTVDFPESRYARARSIPLRDDLVKLLSDFPETTERVFKFSTESLHHVWREICNYCDFTGKNDLRLNDLHRGAIHVDE